MMKSLSVGVSSTGCLVNSLSKLEVSRLSLCQMESKHINTAYEGNTTHTCQLVKPMTSHGQSQKEPCAELFSRCVAHTIPCLSLHIVCWLQERKLGGDGLRKERKRWVALRIVIKWRMCVMCVCSVFFGFEMNWTGNYFLPCNMS